MVLYNVGMHGPPRHRAHVHDPRPEAAAGAVRARPHLPRRHGRRRPALQHAARAGAGAHGSIRHQHVRTLTYLNHLPYLQTFIALFVLLLSSNILF